MGSHFVLINHREKQVFLGPNALDDALASAEGCGAIWEMTPDRAKELGLTDPIGQHDLLEVSTEANILLWMGGKFSTTTGRRPAK